MTELPLVEKALLARNQANQRQAAVEQRELDQRIEAGIRLMRINLGITTTPDQWGPWGGHNMKEAQIILDGVIIHTWRNSGGTVGDVLRTGECDVRSLEMLGQLIVSKAAKLNLVPCPTCHGEGTVVEGAVSQAESC